MATNYQILLLQQDVALVDKALNNLNYSYHKVLEIELNEDMALDQFELFDSYSSRFMRMYEVLVNQLIKSILIYKRERKLTHLDNMNKAEQLGLITNAQDIDEIRKLRNMVAHEYVETEWIAIYKALLEYTPKLRKCVDLSTMYAQDIIDSH